jgi:hypothetical protein
MVVIGDQMRMNANVAQFVKHGLIKRFHRSPASVHEIEPAGLDIAACRHARQAANVVLLECDGFLGKTLEIWSAEQG